MPLKHGNSPKTITGNIAELGKGPQHASNAKKFGEKKAHEIDIAIATNTAKKTGK